MLMDSNVLCDTMQPVVQQNSLHAPADQAATQATNFKKQVLSHCKLLPGKVCMDEGCKIYKEQTAIVQAEG